MIYSRVQGVMRKKFYKKQKAIKWSLSIKCTYYELAHNKKDAKEVIIDELLAQLLLFALIKVCILPKYNILLIYLLGFFMFRFFDISKLWPISLIDKKVGYGLGVMLDDFAAALFTAI